MLKKIMVAGGLLLGAGAMTGQVHAAASPCQASLDFLQDEYKKNEDARISFQLAYDGLRKELPDGYSYNGSTINPWKDAGDGKGLMLKMVDFYKEVCTTLPQIVGTNDNALDSIQYFAWLYYHNEAGRLLVEGWHPKHPDQLMSTVRDFLILFNRDYKRYMDSTDSRTYIEEWVKDPRLEIQDYVYKKAKDYKSWNAFFARDLAKPEGAKEYPSRPVTMPDRDYVVVSPTDCIMNPLVQAVKLKTGEIRRKLVDNPLQKDTVLDVKGIPISVDDLLANAPKDLKDKFDGATGLACVLMPNTYHHFHSPVDGTIKYAEIVEAKIKANKSYAFGTFGYSDWPNWVPLDGNVGRPGTDFSQFEGFQRGVVIIEIEYKNLPGKKPEKLKGYVASIPVGLDTVGSVVFHEGVKVGHKVTKGVTPLGNFFFGGSLNILIFSPIQGVEGSPAMVSPAVQTRMGNQITVLNTPYAPPKTPWTAGE